MFQNAVNADQVKSVMRSNCFVLEKLYCSWCLAFQRQLGTLEGKTPASIQFRKHKATAKTAFQDCVVLRK